MTGKYFLLDGKKYLWKEIVKMRHEQMKAARQAAQLGDSRRHPAQIPAHSFVKTARTNAFRGEIKLALFQNFYRCDRCGHEWTDDWSATCDDDCPSCGARHMTPYKSEDIAESEAELDEKADNSN
jgi:rubrerythrin